jgi:hypothetical protein
MVKIKVVMRPFFDILTILFPAEFHAGKGITALNLPSSGGKPAITTSNLIPCSAGCPEYSGS